MLVDAITKRYASAVFNMAKEQNLIKEVKGELEYFGNYYNTVAGLRLVLNNPLISPKHKYELLQKALQDALSSICRKFLELLIRKGRLKHLPDIINAYDFLLDQYNGVVRVGVTSFAPLSLVEEEKLKKQLKWYAGAGEIILATTIDKTILGGMMIQIGDMVIDGSVKSRLHELKTHMLTRIEQGKLSNIGAL